MKKNKAPYNYLLSKVLERASWDCDTLNKTKDLELYNDLMDFIESYWLFEICEVLGIEKGYPHIKATLLSKIRVKKEDCKILDLRRTRGEGHGHKILSVSGRNSKKN